MKYEIPILLSATSGKKNKERGEFHTALALKVWNISQEDEKKGRMKMINEQMFVEERTNAANMNAMRYKCCSMIAWRTRPLIRNKKKKQAL